MKTKVFSLKIANTLKHHTSTGTHLSKIWKGVAMTDEIIGVSQLLGRGMCRGYPNP